MTDTMGSSQGPTAAAPVSGAACPASGSVSADGPTASSGTAAAVAAVDLGATSGRVIVGRLEDGRLSLRHVARFPNHIVEVAESGTPALHWDVLELFRCVMEGLREAVTVAPDLSSIGIDSWAVDYGLLRGGALLGSPYNYRDARTAAGVASVHAKVPAADLYRANGLQHLDFNTLFQFEADRIAGRLDLAERALLIPDLLGYWLTGRERTELTNASTTGLLDPRTREWSGDLFEALGLPRELLAPLVAPGERVGSLLPSVAAKLGAGEELGVVAVGSHDTASAIVAVPMKNRGDVYISSGTWSLVGQELDAPVVTEESAAANFTNEGGVDARVRFLKNVSGLWLLTESMREWSRADATASQRSAELQELLAAAAEVTGPVPVFDAEDPRFTPPGDMPGRIAAWCEEHGVTPPRTRAEFVRSILASLVEAYASTIETAQRLSGVPATAVHVVGGGSQNALLCQLTADRTGLPVVAGPVEATAIGNVLVQLRAAGVIEGDLEALREIVTASFDTVTYLPS